MNNPSPDMVKAFVTENNPKYANQMIRQLKAYAKVILSMSFDDIGGIDNVVQQVREVIELPMISPAIFDHYHFQPHKGIQQNKRREFSMLP